MSTRNDGLHAPAPLPWWRVKMVWLVVGGPLVVVAASFVTLGIAITHPDPVLAPRPATSVADTPAVEARNHAASPQR